MRRRFGANMTMLRRYHAPILQQRRALPYPDRITRNHARNDEYPALPEHSSRRDA